MGDTYYFIADPYQQVEQIVSAKTEKPRTVKWRH
jgi:hypothetical protein